MAKTPKRLVKSARKLDQVDSVTALSELRIPPINKLEALSGNRKGQYSIRINANIGFALYGLNQVLTRLRLLIITRNISRR